MLIRNVLKSDGSASRTTKSWGNRRMVHNILTSHETWILGAKTCVSDALQTHVSDETFQVVADSVQLDGVSMIYRLLLELKLSERTGKDVLMLELWCCVRV